MANIIESIPDKYTWEPEGLFYMGASQKIKIIDAMPEVITHVERTLATGKISEYLVVRLRYTTRLSEAKRYRYDDAKDIKKMISELVQIGNAEPGRVRKAEEVFRFMVHKQQAELRVVQERECQFGWNDEEFFWGDTASKLLREAKKQEYEAAQAVASLILADETNICGMLFLAAVQGPMKSIMHKMGIDHDCVLYIVGKTGTGKTELARKFCDYIPDKNQVYTLDSNRKALKMRLAKIRDATVVIDDLCKTSSKGMYDRRLQTVSEIIQNASDAAPVLLDEDCEADFRKIHLVVTAEEKPKNPSTINRCLLISLDEKLPTPLWNSIGETADRNYIRYTVWNFVQWIMDNYHSNLQKIKADYDGEIRKAFAKKDQNARINSTFCLQMTIKNAVVRFMRRIELPNEIVTKVDAKLSECIRLAVYYTEDELERQKAKNNHMECLHYFLYVLWTIMDWEIKESEDEYVNGEGKGMVLTSGYFSFDPKRICAQINEQQKFDIMNPVKLGKELRYYGLIYINSEGKNSCCFHSRKKWFHVDVNAVLNFVNENDQIDELTKEMFSNGQSYLLSAFKREEEY